MSKVNSLYLQQTLEFLARQIGVNVRNAAQYGNSEYTPKISTPDNYMSMQEQINAICQHLGIEIKKQTDIIIIKKDETGN